jgi:hypothetical protein
MRASGCVFLLKLSVVFLFFVFLSPGAENVEQVLVTIIQGAVDYPDPIAQKTCFIILSKLVELWGEARFFFFAFVFEILSTPSSPPHPTLPQPPPLLEQEPKALGVLVSGPAVGNTSSLRTASTLPTTRSSHNPLHGRVRNGKEF